MSSVMTIWRRFSNFSATATRTTNCTSPAPPGAPAASRLSFLPSRRTHRRPRRLGVHLPQFLFVELTHTRLRYLIDKFHRVRNRKPRHPTPQMLQHLFLGQVRAWPSNDQR